MKVVIAPDSFKESLSAAQAAEALRRGVLAAVPGTECTLVPLADGGEGTVDALTDALHGELVTAAVTGPLGAPVHASYGWAGAERLAIIEVAAAVGLDLVPRAERDVWHATSRGVGELLLDALDRGATRVIVGLGGSATNDGGAGMLQALGLRLLDSAGADIGPGPAGLEHLASADPAGLDRRLKAVEVLIASDVTNPLLGPAGASAVFGPQKGASAPQIPRLDAALGRLAPVLDGLAGRAVRDVPGAGAAGGLGAALLACADAVPRPGIEVVMEATRLRQALDGADLVLTGEGSVDAQSLQGKTPFGVARAAAAAGVPTIVFAGRVGPGAEALHEHGVTAIVPITRAATSLEEALAAGAANLQAAATTAFRLIGLGSALEAGDHHG